MPVTIRLMEEYLAVGLVLVLLGAAMGYFTGQVLMTTVQTVFKQVAIWLGIVALLPLAVWYGTNVFSPPPDWKQFRKGDAQAEEKIRESKDEAEKKKLQEEKEQREKEWEEAERLYYGHMFWVAYPVGLLAIIVGTFYPVQVVGSGLMFGGLISLTTGCYSYWDKMGDQLRFGSLVVALVVLLVLGTWRFRAQALDKAAPA